ncbi:MAG: Do family serine endopeptidase [Zoogloeaceae bacterium]|jgi:Do/DeqQ family serine protease|nr:Do family serine endopeptidase [Zoogloeaceae bacterium]
MRRLWLIFSQAVTISVAALFVVMTLKPDWLGGRPAPAIVALHEAAAPAGVTIGTTTGTHVVGATETASYAEAARKALPSVVHIYTSKEARASHPLANDPVFRYFFGDRFGGPQRQSGLGSGVIVSADGYILTNNHVVENMDEIEVATNDGRRFTARVAGLDPETDLAVLQVKTDGSLPAVTFAPTESLRVGDVVLAIGNPFGVGQTVTHGIVSALGRSQLGINTFENFIQTDAAINPGNSGGALTDSAGNLVGINTAIYSRSGGSLGIGFAIPVSIARSVMEQIIQTGAVTRGWIGVEAQEITPELAESFKLPASEGALIAGVMRGSPADRAGIRPGDVLVAVGGKAVKDPRGMLELIASLKPGATVPFKFRRETKEVDLPVAIGKRPPMQRNDQE